MQTLACGQEIYRVLAPGGKYVCFSTATNDLRLTAFTAMQRVSIAVEATPSGDGIPLRRYVLTARKRRDEEERDAEAQVCKRLSGAVEM
jgi:hypothetical protein